MASPPCDSKPQTGCRCYCSQDTIRKRLRSGELQGQKVKGAGGFRWEVFVADDPTVKSDTDDTNDDTDGGALVQILRDELAEKNRQISELHRLLAQTALNAAPTRPWWAFWR